MRRGVNHATNRRAKKDPGWKGRGNLTAGDDALVKCGDAVGAEEFIRISSAHAFFYSLKNVAQYFPPRRVQLTEKNIAEFCEKLIRIQMTVKTTINPGLSDLEKWRQIGTTQTTYHSLGEEVSVGEVS